MTKLSNNQSQVSTSGEQWCYKKLTGLYTTFKFVSYFHTNCILSYTIRLCIKWWRLSIVQKIVYQMSLKNTKHVCKKCYFLLGTFIQNKSWFIWERRGNGVVLPSLHSGLWGLIAVAFGCLVFRVCNVEWWLCENAF